MTVAVWLYFVGAENENSENTCPISYTYVLSVWGGRDFMLFSLTLMGTYSLDEACSHEAGLCNI